MSPVPLCKEEAIPRLPNPGYTTKPDDFGLFRAYSVRPAATLSSPQQAATCEAQTLEPESRQPPGYTLRGFGRNAVQCLSKAANYIKDSLFYPFLNEMVFRLMEWAHTGSNLKSDGEMQRLIDDVLLAPDFDLGDLRDVRITREWERLDLMDQNDDLSGTLDTSDGWQESSVKIALPKEKSCHATEQDAPTFEVPKVYHRNLVDIIKTVCAEPDAAHHQFVPFKHFWRRPRATTNDGSNTATEDIRLYSELYDSNVLLDEYEKIKIQLSQTHDANVPDLDDTQAEIAIAPLMPYSDSTHVTNFGSASLWPIYLYFGSVSVHSEQTDIVLCPSLGIPTYDAGFVSRCI